MIRQVIGHLVEGLVDNLVLVLADLVSVLVDQVCVLAISDSSPSLQIEYRVSLWALR